MKCNYGNRKSLLLFIADHDFIEINMIFLGLGSNLGDRQKYLEKAMELLEIRDIHVIQKSSIYETEPVDMPPDAPGFLNMVIQIETFLPPVELLKVCQDIEGELGRPYYPSSHEFLRDDHDFYESRVIDIDLLFYDDQILSSDFLILPHPKIHERFFVLAPMKEIAPEFIHPVLKKTMHELYDVII